MPKANPISVEKLWQLDRLGAPSLSPDGAQVVVPVTRYSMDDNKGASTLWLLSTLGGQARTLTTAGDKDGQPQWSPQVQRLCFGPDVAPARIPTSDPLSTRPRIAPASSRDAFSSAWR